MNPLGVSNVHCRIFIFVFAIAIVVFKGRGVGKIVREVGVQSIGGERLKPIGSVSLKKQSGHGEEDFGCSE